MSFTHPLIASSSRGTASSAVSASGAMPSSGAGPVCTGSGVDVFDSSASLRSSAARFAPSSCSDTAGAFRDAASAGASPPSPGQRSPTISTIAPSAPASSTARRREDLGVPVSSALAGSSVRLGGRSRIRSMRMRAISDRERSTRTAPAAGRSFLFDRVLRVSPATWLRCDRPLSSSDAASAATSRGEMALTRSGANTSSCSARGAARANSSCSQRRSSSAGWRGWRSADAASCRMRTVPRSDCCRSKRSTSAAVRARALPPSPWTNSGRPSTVSHHSPTASASAPSSRTPRSRLTTSVPSSPGVSGESEPSLRPRNASTRCVHQGSRTSCPSTRRLMSSAPHTCSASENAQPSQSASRSTSMHTATASSNATRAPANGPSLPSIARIRRCTPGTRAARSAEASVSVIEPSQRNAAARSVGVGRVWTDPRISPMCRVSAPPANAHVRSARTR